MKSTVTVCDRNGIPLDQRDVAGLNTVTLEEQKAIAFKEFRKLYPDGQIYFNNSYPQERKKAE